LRWFDTLAEDYEEERFYVVVTGTLRGSSGGEWRGVGVLMSKIDYRRQASTGRR
jgi:hypothetical protein